MNRLTFESADRLLDSTPHLERRKLGNNTYLRRLPNDDLAVTLHETDIIILHRDGTFTLDSGGWHTVTTKQRMNALTPARIWQEKGVWYMWPDKIPFFDCIVVDANGKPVECMQTHSDMMKDRDKELRKQIQGIMDKLNACEKLPLPDAGDCWGCYMATQDGERPLGRDCVASHLAELYLHGSLIYRALQWRGYTDYAIGLYWRWWGEGEIQTKRIVRRALRSFLRDQAYKIAREEARHAVRDQ